MLGAGDGRRSRDEMAFQTRQSEHRQTPTGERERIREALFDLCFEFGYAALDVDRLCRRAAIERAAFDRRFASLEECFLSFYEPEMRAFKGRMEAAGQGHAEWRDRLRATAYELFRFLLEDYRRNNFVVVESRAAGERALLIFAEGIRPLFDLLDRGRAEPAAPPTLTRATAEQIGGGILNELYSTLARREEIALDLVAPMMFAAVLPYLGPEVAAEELTIQPPPDLAGGRGEERG